MQKMMRQNSLDKNVNEYKFPNKLVVDTSVALKWYLNEDKSDKAQKLYQQIKFGECFVIAPEYILIEMSNVLLKRYKLPVKEINDIISDILSIGIEFIEQKIFNYQHLISYASKHKLSIYDTLFLETCFVSNFKLITADIILSKSCPEQTILL